MNVPQFALTYEQMSFIGNALVALDHGAISRHTIFTVDSQLAYGMARMIVGGLYDVGHTFDVRRCDFSDVA